MGFDREELVAPLMLCFADWDHIYGIQNWESFVLNTGSESQNSDRWIWLLVNRTRSFSGQNWSRDLCRYKTESVSTVESRVTHISLLTQTQIHTHTTILRLHRFSLYTRYPISALQYHACSQLQNGPRPSLLRDLQQSTLGRQHRWPCYCWNNWCWCTCRVLDLAPQLAS